METNMFSAIVFLYFCNLIFLSSAQAPGRITLCEYISSTELYYCSIIEECCYVNGEWRCINQFNRALYGDSGNQPKCEKKSTRSIDPSTINTYSRDNSDEKTSSGTIVPIVIPFVLIISCGMSFCRYYVWNKKAKKRKIIRLQQSRTVRPISEQTQYRILDLYHDNGNSAAIIANPETQGGCLNDGERLDTSTLENNNGDYLQDDTTYTPTVNPPAYEDIINRNVAAIDSVDPRTHRSVDVEGLANSTINNDYVTTASIPKVKQHTAIL